METWDGVCFEEKEKENWDFLRKLKNVMKKDGVTKYYKIMKQTLHGRKRSTDGKEEELGRRVKRDRNKRRQKEGKRQWTQEMARRNETKAPLKWNWKKEKNRSGELTCQRLGE